MKFFNQNWNVIMSFAAIYFIWGSTYLTIMLALDSFPPFMLAGIRFFTAGILLFMWCKFSRDTIPSIRDIIKISFVGILLLFFGSGSVIWVEQYLSSGLTSIIWASLPIWLIILDRRNWLVNFSNIGILVGLILGFTGVFFLLNDNELLNFSDNSMKRASFLVAVCGTIIFASGSLYMNYQCVKGTMLIKASIQMIAAGLLSILASIILGEQYQIIWDSISINSFLSLFYLIVMGSLVAYLAYVWLISIMPPVIVGTYTYVNPVVAVFLGWSILSEIISIQRLMALLMILLGVLIINIYKSKNVIT